MPEQQQVVIAYGRKGTGGLIRTARLCKQHADEFKRELVDVRYEEHLGVCEECMRPKNK